MPEPLTPIPLPDIEAARVRLRGISLRTPLVRLGLPGASPQILLKLENLQPIGSFKLRGAANAMAVAGREALAGGVVTASAGNMAQGVAWSARELGVRCRVVVPETAPETKVAAIERLGGEVIKVPFAAWWQAMQDHRYPGVDGLFIHPFADASRTVVAACHAASRRLCARAGRPFGYAAEVETSAPFAASLAEGRPATIPSAPSFVDGIGGTSVFAEMWPLARELLAGSVTASVAQIAAAVRLLAERNRVVAEGAGAAPVAAAMTGATGAKTIVCVVSGGNIDGNVLAAILRGEIPTKEH